MPEGWEYHLNIWKPMLRGWRKGFARHLCALAVTANATRPMASRKMRTSRLQGIHRPVNRLGPEVIEVEVTESAGLARSCAADNLCKLAHLGIRLAIDDFGSGYSNLNLLARLP